MIVYLIHNTLLIICCYNLIYFSACKDTKKACNKRGILED